MDDYLTRPVGVRLDRLRSTPEEAARLLEGRDEAALSRRPDARSWSPTEILCHLRDVEELFLVRFQTIGALRAFGRRRREVVTLRTLDGRP